MFECLYGFVSEIYRPRRALMNAQLPTLRQQLSVSYLPLHLMLLALIMLTASVMSPGRKY
jgi:hypothetical protein